MVKQYSNPNKWKKLKKVMHKWKKLVAQNKKKRAAGSVF